MALFHDWTHNWGVAIILLTILIKLLFFPLSAASYRSMAKMRKLQPKLMELRERYGEDRQKLSQETMDLYRKEKVNPLGGCLPMFLQLPVFVGLFYALRSSIHLRQAPFFGWIDDLAAPDMLLQYSLHDPRRGRDDIKAFMTDFRKAFPDLNFWGPADLIAEGRFDEAKGDVKEAVGDATGNEDLEHEGKKDRTKGKAKQALGSTKDAAGKAKEAAADAVDSAKDRMD